MSAGPMLRKPLYGGLFGQGEFELATQALVSNGLHAVRFMVIQPRFGRVLAIADTKTEVLAGARRVLCATSAANDEPAWVQPSLWTSAELAVVAAPAPSRPVARRRREVFLRSGGCCCYCGTPLKLDGEWHIEHQLPRALGGTDEPVNLVAACVPCNLQKSDQSALEFVLTANGGAVAGGRCG